MSGKGELEELRKIQVTGGSTYIISLPKAWVDHMGLGRGSVVSMIQSGDMSLNLRSKDQISPERIKKVIITIHEGDKPESVVRHLVSSYLGGYNIIDTINSETNRPRDSLRDQGLYQEEVGGY